MFARWAAIRSEDRRSSTVRLAPSSKSSGLPDLEQFAPDEQARQFIRERLSGRSIQSTLEETDEDLEEERDLMGEDYGDPDDDLVIVGNATDDYDD